MSTHPKGVLDGGPGKNAFKEDRFGMVTELEPRNALVA